MSEHKQDHDRATGSAYHVEREPVKPMPNWIVDQFTCGVFAFASVIAGALLYYVIFLMR